MKISDLLRNLADSLDAAEPETTQVQEPDQSDAGSDNQPADLFVPPLQLKMELLKKAAGVESIYDEDEEVPAEQHQYPREMMQIRRNAGLDPAVMSELSDDEPLDI